MCKGRERCLETGWSGLSREVVTAVLVLSSRRPPSALLGAPLLGLPRPKHMPQSPCQRCPRTRGTVGSVLASPHHSLVPDSVVHSEVSRHHRGGWGCSRFRWISALALWDGKVSTDPLRRRAWGVEGESSPVLCVPESPQGISATRELVAVQGPQPSPWWAESKSAC